MRRSAIAVALIAGLSVPSVAEPRRSAAETMDILMWGREPIGGRIRADRSYRHVAHRAEIPRQAAAGLLRFHLLPGYLPNRSAEYRPGARPAWGGGRQSAAVVHYLDPERDTPAHLAEYVPTFHSRLIGLTGDASAIQAVADAYKVYYAKVANEGGNEYTVDHTAFIYLMGIDGKYLGFFPPGTAPERIAYVVRQQTALMP